MHRAVVDVAGVPVALMASDDGFADRLRSVFAGFPRTHARPLASVTVDDDAVAVPSRAHRDELDGIRLWEAPDGVVVSSGAVVLEVVGSEVIAHVPDPRAERELEAVLPVGLAWILGRHGRFVIHGGAVARDGHALLALGHSGAGKSTLIAAALEYGWEALSDDLVMLTAVADGVEVVGLLQPPAVPIEIGGPVVAAGTPLGAPRHRAILGREVLSTGSRRVAGVVVVGHSDKSGGSLDAANPYPVLALLLQSFAGSIDPALRAQYFAFTKRLGALPAWELGHAADVASRRKHVDRALEECWRRAMAP